MEETLYSNGERTPCYQAQGKFGERSNKITNIHYLGILELRLNDQSWSWGRQLTQRKYTIDVTLKFSFSENLMALFKVSLWVENCHLTLPNHSSTQVRTGSSSLFRFLDFCVSGAYTTEFWHWDSGGVCCPYYLWVITLYVIDSNCLWFYQTSWS